MLAAVALAAALAALRPSARDAAVQLEPQRGPFRGSVLPEGIARRPAPEFELTDARGRSLGTDDMAGRPYLVTFLFSDCPDVCPLIAQEIRRAFELLGPRAGRAATLAVSVDPDGDTPANVRRFLRRQRLPANFHYLIGERGRLEPVWNAYFAAPQIAGRADSIHTASVWLVDAQGRIRTKFSGGAPIPPADIAHDLRLLIREADGERAAR